MDAWNETRWDHLNACVFRLICRNAIQGVVVQREGLVRGRGRPRGGADFYGLPSWDLCPTTPLSRRTEAGSDADRWS